MKPTPGDPAARDMHERLGDLLFGTDPVTRPHAARSLLASSVYLAALFARRSPSSSA